VAARLGGNHRSGFEDRSRWADGAVFPGAERSGGEVRTADRPAEERRELARAEAAALARDAEELRGLDVGRRDEWDHAAGHRRSPRGGLLA
jgi:hypothetical protein